VRPFRAVRGMTLLEVLIAIVVLVLAVSTIIPLFAVGTTAHKRGVDQDHLAWLAPRVAARIQESLYDANPQPIRGYVREMEDGSVVIDNATDARRYKDDGGAAYRFEATFKPLSMGGRGDPMPGTAFLLRVELYTREGGEPRAEQYETVVLRKLLR
jgi:type II secretory pathway pseudopilin PulG